MHSRGTCDHLRFDFAYSSSVLDNTESLVLHAPMRHDARISARPVCYAAATSFANTTNSPKLPVRCNSDQKAEKSEKGPRLRVCFKSWLTVERRLSHGQYDRLMVELKMEDHAAFFNLLRMPADMFDKLLHHQSPRLTKQDTNYRKALSPGLKLAITIRYLSTGTSICFCSIPSGFSGILSL